MTAVSIIRSIGGLTFDVTVSESHERTLTIVESPVERGSPIPDHAYMEPKELTIVAGVSDTPLAVQPVDPFDSGSGRSKRAYELICALQRQAEPFDVQTGLELYQNMLIKNIRTMQDKNSAGVLLFTAQLREVEIRHTRSVAVYPPRQTGEASRQADPVKDKGVQQSEPVTNKSYLVKIKDRVGSYLDGL